MNPSNPATKSTTKRVPYQSPEQALHFKKAAWKRAEMNLGLPCQCQAYVDVLTAGRWRALGCHIRRGEAAALHVGRAGNTPVFCRCQVVAFGSTEPVQDRRPIEQKSAAVLLASVPQDVLADLAMQWLATNGQPTGATEAELAATFNAPVPF